MDGKNRITQSTSTPPAQYDGAVGDRWERMSCMGSGGRLISNWRWNGDVWVSTLISDAVLGNVDAAKIGTGYLDAARIAAGTITADKMIVGSDENLLPMSAVDSGATTEPHRPMSGATMGMYSSAAMGFQNALYVRRQMEEAGWKEILQLSSGGLSGEVNDGHYFPVSPGRSYRANADLMKSGPYGNPTANLQLNFYDIQGRYLSANFSDSVVVSNWTLVPDRHVWVVGEAPEDAAWMGLRLRSDQQGNIVVVRPRLAELKGSTLIQDGAITTDKVAANAIVAGKIAAGAVEAETIAAGAIDADHIVAGGIQADAILVGGSVGATLIEGGAITTDKIAVGAITSDSGIFGEIDAGILTAGEIAAARIGAKSITGDKLLIGGTTNLLPGGDSIADSTAGWSAFGRNTSDPSVWLRGQTTVETDAGFTLRGGTTYRASVDVRASVSGARFFWQLLHIEDRVGPYVFSGVEVGTGYSSFESEFTVPESGDYVLRVYANHSSGVPNSGYMWFRHPRIAPMTGATLIEDGAITTDKILANAITAGKIAALAIEADHIAANAVQADKIDAGAIDGKIITGATVRTNESGARVQMNPTGLYAYNPSNEQTFSINANTGAVGITGNLTQRNSYGSLQVGPSLFNVSDGGNGSPAITLREAGSTVWGPAGILLKESGTDQTLNIQGPLAASGQGAYLALPVHGSSRSVGIRRMFGDGDHSYLSLSQDRGVHLQSSGGNAYLSSRHATLDYSRAYVSTSSDGQITLRTQQTSKSSVRGGYINLDTNGVVVTAGNGASGVVARNLYLNAYGTARFQSFPTGSSGSAKSYIRAENNGEITIAGDGGGIYYRLTSDGWHRASGIYGQSVIEPVQGMTIDNTGKIGRYGSSRRWKTAIETISTDDYEDALLSVEYKSWIYTKTQERSEELRQYRADNPMAPVPEHLAAAQDDPARQTGMIAEELHDAGVTELVGYDQYGRPDSIIRENFGMALVPIIKRLRDRVDALETQLGATE